MVVTAQFADSGLDLSLLTMSKLKIHTSFDPVNSYKGTLGIKKVARYLDISSVSSKTTHLSKRDDYFRLAGDESNIWQPAGYSVQCQLSSTRTHTYSTNTTIQ